jgi:hypothetical protein
MVSNRDIPGEPQLYLGWTPGAMVPRLSLVFSLDILR